MQLSPENYTGKPCPGCGRPKVRYGRQAQKRRTSKMLSRMTEIPPLCLTPDLSLMEDLNLLKAYMDTLYELMGIDYH
jgi:hypothetical protein